MQEHWTPSSSVKLRALAVANVC